MEQLCFKLQNVNLTCIFLCVFILFSSGIQAAPGKDGSDSISTPNTQLNTYSPLVSSSTSPVTGLSITVGNINDLSDASGLYASAPLEAGDLIMIYQAQGATISTVDSAAFGSILDYGNSGRYELHQVQEVSGNSILLGEVGVSCNAGMLINNYNLAQVIRVPQFENLTITAAGTVVPAAWDGNTGGIVAVEVNGTLLVNGSIDASGLGFRGGAIDNLTTTQTTAGAGVVTYRSGNAQDGAEKGESIAGDQTVYDTLGGRYARGAPANGGGGGNAHNAGGGGGANGDNGVVWNGQGNPDINTDPAWITAWDFDGTLTSTTTSSGGGRGGYTFAFNNNPLTTPPGSPAWSGDARRERGGLGGRPLEFSSINRVFFGGGGGAGDGNNNAAGAGGNGGGLILVNATTITGGGTIISNGADGASTTPLHNDAPGGGGAGGTIIVKSDSLAGSLNLSADGADGGDQLITVVENEGPGGGGGGGVIALSGGLPTTSANFGVNGITNSSAVTTFVANGATFGATGQPNESSPTDATFPFCVIGADLSVTKNDSVPSYTPGTPFSYTIIVDNNGPDPADGSTLTDTIPSWAQPNPPATDVEWTCSAVAGASCSNATGIGNINEVIPDFPTGGSVSFTISGLYSTDMNDY